jgi:cation-transporting ATPase E
MPPITTSLQGLSEQEAIARRAAGQGNDASLETSRTYADIFRDNLFTFINAVYFSICLILISLGRLSDVFVIAIVILLNIVLSIYQEIRAKKKLDQISLLTRPQAIVVREGVERSLDPAEIVIGDLLVVQPGDQIVVDGRVLASQELKVDESLLTGESDLIPKSVGDLLYSGSFCVSGKGYFETEKVGADCFASQVTTQARAYRKPITPLQQEINLVIRVLLAIALLLGLFVGFRILIGLLTFASGVNHIAVITGLVPSGLYLMITLAYALGSLHIAQKKALIQQANAVESLSNVDVLCLDKTGTLTTNRIQLDTLHPIGLTEAQLRQILADFAASVSASNRTNAALAEGCPGEQRPVKAELPFGSAHKWSALAFEDRPGVYVLGAPEVLAQAVALTAERQATIQTAADRGLRVLLFAYSSTLPPLQDAAGTPQLPPQLEPLGILQFSDELRPDARSTLEKFLQAGIQVKIISGDNPLTVAALARQAGLSHDIQAISGQALNEMDDNEFFQTAQTSTIFGRITPDQKARLVKALKSCGHYVAMMGDGVNDVPSLKQANVGIAMESGSQATRGVADIVLLQNSFQALPDTFREGQRIRNGIEDVTKLFLVRVLSFALVIVAVGLITFTFPVTIKQGTLATLLPVGIPTYCVTLWAKPGPVRKGAIVPTMLDFLIPATVALSIGSLVVYLGLLLANAVPVLALLQGITSAADLRSIISSEQLRGALAIAQSGLVTIQIVGGILLILFLKPPHRVWHSSEPVCGDRRYVVLAMVLLGLFGLILGLPPLRAFFELQLLSAKDYGLIALIVLLWWVGLRNVWRHHLLERFLGIHLR